MSFWGRTKGKVWSLIRKILGPPGPSSSPPPSPDPERRRKVPSRLPPTLPRSLTSEPLFSTLPSQLIIFNYKAAELLFSRLGIPVIPNLFREHCKAYDAPYALCLSFQQVGIPSEIMHDPGKRGAHLTRLQQAVNFILQVEKEAEATPLPPKPIFDLLKKPLAEAEDLFKRFLKIKEVWKSIDTSVTDFPDHGEFKVIFSADLKNWEHILDKELSEAQEINGIFQTLQERLISARTQLSHALVWLDWLAESEEVHSLADQIRKRKEGTEAGICSGLLEPHDGIGTLEELLGHCEGADPRVEHGVVLSTLVKLFPPFINGAVDEAYRGWLKEYRPTDIGKDDPQVKENFIKLTDARRVFKDFSRTSDL